MLACLYQGLTKDGQEKVRIRLIKVVDSVASQSDGNTVKTRAGSGMFNPNLVKWRKCEFYESDSDLSSDSSDSEVTYYRRKDSSLDHDEHDSKSFWVDEHGARKKASGMDEKGKNDDVKKASISGEEPAFGERKKSSLSKRIGTDMAVKLNESPIHESLTMVCGTDEIGTIRKTPKLSGQAGDESLLQAYKMGEKRCQKHLKKTLKSGGNETKKVFGEKTGDEGLLQAYKVGDKISHRVPKKTVKSEKTDETKKAFSPCDKTGDANPKTPIRILENPVYGILNKPYEPHDTTKRALKLGESTVHEDVKKSHGSKESVISEIFGFVKEPVSENLRMGYRVDSYVTKGTFWPGGRPVRLQILENPRKAFQSSGTVEDDEEREISLTNENYGALAVVEGRRNNDPLFESDDEDGEIVVKVFRVTEKAPGEDEMKVYRVCKPGENGKTLDSLEGSRPADRDDRNGRDGDKTPKAPGKNEKAQNDDVVPEALEEEQNSKSGDGDNKESGELPDGVELSLWELQEMATRQQQQIESQHQILVAKEQRLRYLKHQEGRTHLVAAENERLRRLRDRVEAQELKLRKLRALRGQVDQDKLGNGTLTSDLQSIKALFNEKEKELSLAVAKVEELTRQLEELRRNGRFKEAEPTTSAALELDKLRRELVFRNKLKEQQNVQISQQRDALNKRQLEINAIDQRITELQDRLQRKRLLNQQLAQQLQNNNNGSNGGGGGSNNSGGKNNSNMKQVVTGGGRPGKPTPGLIPGCQAQRQNLAFEPFLHTSNSYQQKLNELLKQNNTDEIHKSNGYQKGGPKPLTNKEEPLEGVKQENNKNKGVFIETKEEIKTENIKDEFGKMAGTDGKNKENNGREYIPEFAASKSDPKYQTLPYNTKFGLNYKNATTYQNGTDPHVEQGDGYLKSTGGMNPVGIQQQQPLMTVHSTPILAPSLSSASRIPSHLNPRVYGHQVLTSRGQPVGGTSPSSSTSSLATSTSSSSSSNMAKTNYGSAQKGSGQFQQKPSGKNAKPVTNVAPPNVVQKSTPKNFLPSTEKPSPIYQTSSTKILPAQPQTLGSTPQGVLKEMKGGELSPPLSSSTPLGTPESAEARNKKPALPPKPAIPLKPTPPPPPRQAHPPECPESKGYIEITPESLEQALNLKRVPEHARTDKVPFDSDPSRTPTPPPPPPPTTEPPDDATSRRTDNPESPAKDEKLVKTNQSSNLVNSNHSANQTNIIINNCNINNISNSNNSNSKNNVVTNHNANNHLHLQNNINSNRRIEIPPSYMFPETESLPADLIQTTLNDENEKYPNGTKFSEKSSEAEKRAIDELDRVITNGTENFLASKMVTEDKIKKVEGEENDSSNNKNNLDAQNNSTGESVSQQIVRRVKKGNLKSPANKGNVSRRVSFDPLALLLDASLEGELELVMKTASQVSNPSAANDEGITALHNAICAGHLEIVKFLVEFGCDVNAQDSDGWTPLHCAASCNNLAMVRFLVEHGACIFATTLSDHETAAEKCEEDEEGFDGCSEYLYSIQEKLGILNNGIVYAVYDYSAHNSDELSFSEGDRLIILRKGDEMEREWWWSRLQDKEGYTPRNLLGLYPRVQPNTKTD